MRAEVVTRLIKEALMTFYSCSEGFTARAVPGAAMTLSGEPLADLNYLVIDSESKQAMDAFREYVAHCDRRGIPFAAMLDEQVAVEARPLCEEFGLAHATEWPVMVCDAGVELSSRLDDVTVRPIAGRADHIAMSEVLESAFHMPAESVRRAMPLELAQSPSIDIFLAERGPAVQSTVTVTWHGRVAGIWAMGTLGWAQGEGVGKALLVEVMKACRQRGIETFYLGATPAGFPLYQSIGYETLFTSQVWVRGETHQA